MGVLDGKVILITGGGNGIGKECALLAAKEGAKVLVNDLGGALTDAGDASGDAGLAEQVAQEIRAAGGEAASNSESVTDMTAVQGMVEQAKDTFGGLHGIINPAGILRDGMFHKMSEDDWRSVIDVHLHGSFNVTRAAIEHFREQEEGSFVLFTSTSGLIGNIGQANYAAAKMGIAGLSRIIAMDYRALCLDPHDRLHPGQGRGWRRTRRADAHRHARRSGGTAGGDALRGWRQTGFWPDLQCTRQ